MQYLIDTGFIGGQKASKCWGFVFSIAGACFLSILAPTEIKPRYVCYEK